MSPSNGDVLTMGTNKPLMLSSALLQALQMPVKDDMSPFNGDVLSYLTTNNRWENTSYILVPQVILVHNETGSMIGLGLAVNIYYDGSVYSEIQLACASTATGYECHGITVSSIDNYGLGYVYISGIAYTNQSWACNTNKKVYLSTTAGQLTLTPPSGSGEIEQVVGIAAGGSAYNILLKPEVPIMRL